jgi:hypothetical protein
MNPIGMNPHSTRTRERFAKYARRVRAYVRRTRERVMISCELQDLEDLMGKAGVLLTGNAYDKAQDYLQDHCVCATYNYLLGYKRGRE